MRTFVECTKDFCAAGAYRLKSLALSLLYRDRNIDTAKQKAATDSSAEYVQRHMGAARSFRTGLELMRDALSHADVNEGLMCEFGVATGWSVNFIAEHVRQKVYGFDSFEGLPQHWHSGFGKGSFAQKTLPHVRENVVLVKGLFHETLPDFLKDFRGDATFLHVDCDLYSSTKTVFSLMRDRIKPGCVIVFDEYFNYPGWERGEHRAFSEFLAETGLGHEYIGYHRAHEQVSVKVTAGCAKS
jgi:hypothetical protein